MSEWLQSSLLQALPGLAHVFTTRSGGVSAGPFTSLNLKYPTTPQDEPNGDAAVRENRRRVCEFLGLPLETLVACQQVHGKNVPVVGLAEAGRGALSQSDGLAASDGLVTAEAGLPLLVMVADCLPVLLADPVSRGLGAVHAGWRGVQQGIVPAAIAQLQRQYGTRPEDLRLVVGPGIGFASFEVGPEVLAAFAGQFDSADPELVMPAAETPKVRLNLAAIVRRQALAAGILPSQIEILQADTFSDKRFYSYRREGGVTGRQGALIGWLADGP